MDLQDITKKIEKMYQQSQEEEKLVKIWKKETIWMLVEYIITHLDEAFKTKRPYGIWV